MSSFPVLSHLIWTPAIGALLLLLPLFREERRCRLFALAVSLWTFAAALSIGVSFDAANPEYQFVERFGWVSEFGIQYYLGIDGISLALVMLTAILMPIVVLASGSIQKNVRGYLIAMLVLETAMLGTLLALDLFLFYVFWELMLSPMYFLIGIWGGQRRIYATLKFVLYTVAGSVLMLLGILYIVREVYSQHAVVTFSLPEILQYLQLPLFKEIWLFGAFALAFGIKVPVWPFHTWLPDAHVEAPTGGSVILAGVLLKMGIYGFLRFAYPLFPRAAEVFAPYMVALAVIGIIYGSLVAWAQTDMKKLVAYSSVAHLGFCILGLAAFNLVSLSGAVYQSINHGISTGALFLLVGVLYDRRHTREISEYGGLAAKLPVFAFLFLVFTLSSIALPLTNGFVGEFLILAGSFKAFPVAVALAVSGVILGAVYMLTLYLRTMYGPLDEVKNSKLEDVNLRELATLVPLLLLVFVMGIYPQPILRRVEPSLGRLMALVEERRAVPADIQVQRREPPAVSDVIKE